MTDVDATPIKVTIGDLVLHGSVGTTSTARDLVAQLPLTLRFRDLNGVEKYADLPPKLSLHGARAGYDPDPADIGYYAPGGTLVFYYGAAGYWPGIVRVSTSTPVSTRSVTSPTSSSRRWQRPPDHLSRLELTRPP